MRIIVLGLAAWFVASLIFGLFIGRVIRLQDDPQATPGVEAERRRAA
jgi:hypothetical protein